MPVNMCYNDQFIARNLTPTGFQIKLIKLCSFFDHQEIKTVYILYLQEENSVQTG